MVNPRKAEIVQVVTKLVKCPNCKHQFKPRTEELLKKCPNCDCLLEIPAEVFK